MLRAASGKEKLWPVYHGNGRQSGSGVPGEGKGFPSYGREYLEQIHLSAPWMAIGYSAENRQAFGAYEKSETIAKIIAKKDKMMSQFPF